MKKKTFFIAALFLFHTCFAEPASDNTLKQEVQNLSLGWEIKDVEEGNINPGKSYVAAILSKNSGEVATLRIFMRTHNKLTLLLDAPNAICTGCGGPRGEQIPFSLMINKKGILEINYEGGGSWGIWLSTKWHYQNNHFYLIGMTETIADIVSKEHWSITRDVNISTLEMMEKLNLPKNNRTLSCSVSKNFQGIELSSYSSYDHFDNMPNCSEAELPLHS